MVILSNSEPGLNLSKREAEPFGGKRFAEGFAERNETFPLGVDLPGFYPAVCPARPHGANRIATLGPDTTSMSSRNPSRINSKAKSVPTENKAMRHSKVIGTGPTMITIM
jgi:hypothetical protein